MSRLRMGSSVLLALGLALTACSGEEDATPLPELVVTGATPERISREGGAITLSGENFFEVAAGTGFSHELSARVCGVPLTGLEVVGEERTIVAPPTSRVTIRQGDSLTGTLPPIEKTGRGDVVVTRPDGRTVTLADAVDCYDPTPSVTSFTLTPEFAQAGVPAVFGWSVESPDDLPLACTLDPGDGSEPVEIGDCRASTSVEHVYAEEGEALAILTVTDDGGRAARRQLVVTVGNAPPDASFTATPDRGSAPLEVTFDASGSSDPDDSITDYSWDFGDGATATGVSVGHTFARGSYTVTLTVTDGDGGTDTATVEITVEPVDDPPTLTLDAPAPIRLGEAITLTGSASDDAGVTDLSLEANGTLVASTDPVGDQVPVTIGAGRWSASWTPSHPGEHALVVTARDASGQEATATATLAVEHDYSVVTNTHDEGYGSLRSAVAHADIDVPITFDPTVFGEPRTIVLESPLLITAPVYIEGPGESLLAIDGNGEHRLIDDREGHAFAITDLTLQNGRAREDDAGAEGDGGAIFVGEGADIATVLQNVTLRRNHARNGGALYASHADVVLVNTTIVENTARGDGGGAYVVGGGTVVISEGALTDNTAGRDGGGVYIAGGGDVVISEGALMDNTAGRDGGGVYIAGGDDVVLDRDVILDKSAIANNVAMRDGGGVHLTDATTVVISESPIAGNEADDEGGGVYAIRIEEIVIHESPIRRNEAGTAGGGIYLDAVSVVIYESPITDNTPDDASYP